MVNDLLTQVKDIFLKLQLKLLVLLSMLQQRVQNALAKKPENNS